MKFNKLSLAACIGLIAILGSLPERAEAIFASVRSTGMAATAIAYPQDSLAVAYNPAGMIAIGNRVDVEAAWLRDHGHSRIHGNLIPIPPMLPQVNGRINLMRTHDYYVGNFGVNTAWCTNLFDCYTLNWTLGVALYNRDFQKVTQNKIQPLFGTTHPGLEYIHEELATSLAVSVYEGHSLGVSLDWHFARIKINGLQNFDNPLFSSHPGHVTNNGYDYSTGVGVTVGYYGKFCDWLSVGATYRPKTTMKRYAKYEGFFAERGRGDVPEKIGGGLAVHPMDCLTVCFDVEYLRWHPIRSLSNKLEPAIKKQLLGSKYGAGFGFRNQTFYRLGVEYQLNECLALRAGYRYGTGLVRPTETATNSLLDDLVRSFLTLGLTWKFNPCGDVSLFFAHGFNAKVHGKNSIPLAPFGGGNVNLNESKDILGLAVGWNW
jgi:long-chain fatty acid transport protein